jgi:hypothetical protein
MTNNSKYNVADLSNTLSKLVPKLEDKTTTKQLEDLTIMIKKLQGISGEGNAESIAKMFNKWSINASEYEKTINELFYTYQKTGTGVDTLTQKMIDNKGIMDELKMNPSQGIKFIGDIEKQGYDANNVFKAIKKAANTMVDDYGVTDLNKGFGDLQTQLQNAKSDTEALDLAGRVFGKRMNVDIVNAIREGKINLSEFLSVDYTKAQDSLKKTGEEVTTIGGAFDKMKNKLDTALGSVLGSKSAWDSFEKWGIKAIDGINKSLDDFSSRSFWDMLKDPTIQENKKSTKKSKSSSKSKSSKTESGPIINSGMPYDYRSSSNPSQITSTMVDSGSPYDFSQTTAEKEAAVEKAKREAEQATEKAKREALENARNTVAVAKSKYDLANEVYSGDKSQNNKNLADAAYADYQSTRNNFNNTMLSGLERQKALIDAQIEDQQKLNSTLTEQKNIINGITSSYQGLFRFSDTFSKLSIEKFSPGKLMRRTSKYFDKFKQWGEGLSKLSGIGIPENMIYDLRQMGIDSLGIINGLINSSQEQRMAIVGNINSISNIAATNATAIIKHEVNGTIKLESDGKTYNLSLRQIDNIVDNSLVNQMNRYIR